MSLFIHEIDGRRPKAANYADAGRGRRDRAGWTEEREALLRKFFKDGLTASQSAKAIGGITRNSVIGKWQRLGLFRGPHGPRTPKEPKAKASPPAIKSRQRFGPAIYRPRALEIVRVTRRPEPKPDKSDYAVSLLDRRSGQCTWPLWDDKTLIRERLYCGAPVKEEKCWCERHHAIGTTKPRKRAA